ncbi:MULTISPECIES: N-acyl-D-amino-acid deacylase family protein [unclassified Sphingomonas]|uniref:N-acyl-D-amino-acid deacylase family protein n=1 Tax=unclassified Sphingomonas TaxID=196159 RepID=UPI002151A3EE|nr:MULTISPECIES: amidohydrolase family protein [unclassified Sphingomonas]MCR5871633.1 amidohydrolase family protein [Sphingomonas sp. J344]UUY00074.1 amidohydrolase family protein [Sphingomonas sp. J315]
MRRAVRVLAAPLLLLPLGAGQDRVPAPRTIDLVIINGQVIDGTGTPARVAEVGVDGDRILYVGQRPRGITARRTLDAKGLTVAPGFIDPHTHSGPDATSPDAAKRQLANHLLQGVTSIAIGNDGGGASDIAGLFARLSANPTGPNVASFTGYGTIRIQVVGHRVSPPSGTDGGEAYKMERLVERAMCDGALGLSAGLFYAPQMFATANEVANLARIAGRYDGIYETHLRDEGSNSIGLSAAIDEAIRIARLGHLPLHIAHIKALGVDAQGTAPRIIEQIRTARLSGVMITADQYPWEASSTSLAAALVPPDAQEGGSKAMVTRLRDIGAQLRSEMTERLRIRGGANAILLVSGPHKGQRLDALAAAWKLDPLDAAARILIADPGTSIASFNMVQSDIDAFARQNWVVTSSDATNGHPRRMGSFARGWRMFVHEKQLMSPERFVQRSSAQTAQILGLPDRGILAPGKFADIAILDPNTYAERATYDRPDEPSTGVRYVLVNGRLAVDKGKLTGTLAGRPLPKPRQPEWNCPA